MLKRSPLAPKNIKKIKQVNGIELYVYSAGLYNNKRLDLTLFLFKNKTSVAEVFTKSSLRSCTLDWNEKNLKNKEIEALIVNSGNANTFTGQAGINALTKISDFVSNKFKVSVKKVFFASTGVIGEKLEIGAFESVSSEHVGFYIHAGNKIATLAGLSNKFENVFDVSKNVAMQVAAMNPIALNEDSVSKEIIEKEIEIAKEQLRAEGKPEAMLDNIAKGKLKKFFKDNTLVKQAYIKDNKSSVENYIQSENNECVITDFKRVALV